MNANLSSIADESAVRNAKPIDMHVHIVGNGTGGTGCWMRLSGLHRPMSWFMLRHIGLPIDSLKGDLDRLYVERLLELVRTSSLGRIVILAHEQVYDDRGRLMEGVGSVYVPNDYVLKLARENPEFLPAVSIHPARVDALDELDRCIAEGAVLLKCLPNCQNIDCNDRRYTRFWERMAEKKLPLLAHTGGEHTVPVVRKELASPQTLELPLDCGVTVIAAHSGTKSGLFDPDYFSVFAKMTQRYPRLYGDNSAFNTPFRGSHIPECLQSPLSERMVCGSDFPVPIYAKWARMRGYISSEQYKKWRNHPNNLERDYQLKRAIGFSEECFTRIHNLLRIEK
ncbi:MAG: amidohydrolase family protein [Verrucomicrobiota bacterium]